MESLEVLAEQVEKFLNDLSDVAFAKDMIKAAIIKDRYVSFGNHDHDTLQITYVSFKKAMYSLIENEGYVLIHRKNTDLVLCLPGSTLEDISYNCSLIRPFVERI